MQLRVEAQKREVKNRAKLMNVIFWIAFTLSIGLRTIQATVLSAYLPKVTVTAGIGIASVLIICKILLFDRTSHGQLFIFTIVVFVTFIVGQISTVHSLLPSLLLILGCLEIPFKKIAKNYVIIVSIVLIVAYITTVIGLTKNYTIVTQDGIKYAMGGTYPTDFAAHIFYLLCAYVYMRAKKINFLDLLLVVFGLVFVKYLTKTQADTIAIFVLLLVVVIYIFQNRILKVKFLKKIYTNVIGWTFIIPGVFAGIIYWLTFSFNYIDPAFTKLNQLFTNRLALGNQAFVSYGIKLFGQPVFQNGWGGTRASIFNSGLGNLTYYFIDSSYVAMLIVYGSFFTVLLLGGLMIHLYQKLRNNDILYVLIWIPILLVSIIDQHLLEVQYNVFLLGLFAYFEQSSNGTFLNVPRMSMSELRHWHD